MGLSAQQSLGTAENSWPCDWKSSPVQSTDCKKLSLECQCYCIECKDSDLVVGSRSTHFRDKISGT